MKKLLSLVLTIILVISLSCIPASAANSGSLSASGTARAGETFNVTFTASGAVGSYSGSFSYDASQVTLVGISNAGGSHWSSFSTNGNNVFSQRDSGTTDSVSFNATFKVNAGVATGTNIVISFSGTIATDVNTENGFSVSTSRTVEAPLSNDATLASLTVSNATLSPAFNAGTLSYSCGKVKFDVAKLGVAATAHDPGASVSVSGANLGVGKNTISIVVTAPSGDKKTYTISVEREQDPNYKASNDGSLAGIEISDGTLSPEFNVKNKEYVVYLPFEVKNITIKGTAANELAKGVEGVENAELKVGVNELILKVTAEDDSVTEYKIYVVRMDEFGGKDTVGLPASLLDLPAVEEPTDVPADETKGFVITPLIAGGIGLVCLLLGFGIGALVFRKKKHSGPDDFDPPEEHGHFEEYDMSEYSIDDHSDEDYDLSDYSEYDDISSESHDDVDTLVDEYLTDI